MINITPEFVKMLAFYGFSALSLGAALLVITAKHSVRAALCLVLTFVSMAAVWLLLESEFLAITLVLVYVGAVMVLFLFVVMMLDVERAKAQASFTRMLPIAMIVGATVVAGLLAIVTLETFSASVVGIPEARPESYSHVKVLGEALFTDYLLPFELAGVMLLVAIIAAISLTFRGSKNPKKQFPSQQVKVRKADRLKIISLKSEGPTK